MLALAGLLVLSAVAASTAAPSVECTLEQGGPARTIHADCLRSIGIETAGYRYVLMFAHWDRIESAIDDELNFSMDLRDKKAPGGDVSNRQLSAFPHFAEYEWKEDIDREQIGDADPRSVIPPPGPGD